jgi:hypothetical protein
MSNYYEDIMPISTNEDEYLKYYIDESLSLLDKLNSIIKKGDPFQRQALITNLDIYARDSLFSSLIQFIISDIGTWESETMADSMILFPKSLYNIIINNILDNELFNIIFKHMIINVSTGADVTKNEYIFYFDKIIEYYSPTKDYIDIDNNNPIKKEFPYIINDDIFEFIISLGKFGQSSINRRLCCYLSSSICRLIIKDENDIQDDNSQKLYTRLSYLFCDGEKIIESQMVRELQYIIPIFKNIMFSNEDINQAIECYIAHDTEHVSQSMTLITLLNNILNIQGQKKIVDNLLFKIKEIIEVKEYEITHKNEIMDVLINCLYNNYKLIPKVVNKIYEFQLIEYYINNFDSYDNMIIFIKNFEKIHFLMNNVEEKYNFDNNIESSTTFNPNNNNNQGQTVEVKCQNKLLIDELFLKIYNKIYNNFESNETNSSFLSIEPSDSMNISTKEKESQNTSLNECKQLLFQNLSKIVSCILIHLKTNKQLMEALIDLFKKDNIVNILNYYCVEKKKNENSTKDNRLYKFLTILLKNNYKKYINNHNNNNNLHYCKEFIYENNYFNKLFLLILNNIFAQFQEIQKESNSNICILIAKTINLLIPKLYKYYKNIVIVLNNANNVNNINYAIGSNNKDNNGNNNNNKKNYLDKILDELFTKIISVVILNNNIGDHIKKEYIQIMPNLILYSRNRKFYLEYMRKEIIKSNNFFLRRYSIIYIEKCFELLSFGFIHKALIYDDILFLLKDKTNIISTEIIKIIYKKNKKIILYSPSIFNDICELLNEIYEININAFNNDIANFDKDKNIIINRILNIKDSSSNDKNNIYNEEDLCSTKDNENKLAIIENDIFNSENNNMDKSKNTKTNEQDNIFQQINSTITSFQGTRNIINGTMTTEHKHINQISNNHIPFNSKGLTKKNSMSDKVASNILKSLTSKNIGNNKHYLPKIKAQKIKKDLNCSNNSNNNNNNIFTIKTNEQKNGIKEKEKIIVKNKCKLIPCSQNRTPSAKISQGNNPITSNANNNYGYDEIFHKNTVNYKVSNKSISNKNLNLFSKSNSKSKGPNFQKDYNNSYIHGNLSNKICIFSEKNNTNNVFFK